MQKFTQGIPKIEWVKIRERNVELDLVILGLACFTMLNVKEVRVTRKMEKVREEKPEKILRRRNWVNKWWDYLQTVSQEKVPSMLLQEIVFSQNRKSSGVTVGMMRSLNTKNKITNSKVIKPKDRKIIFLNDKRI